MWGMLLVPRESKVMRTYSVGAKVVSPKRMIVPVHV